MEIIKEEIGEYIFYIIPEERGESFYIKKGITVIWCIFLEL